MPKLRLVTSNEDYVEIENSVDFSDIDFVSMKILSDFQDLLTNQEVYFQQFKSQVQHAIESISDGDKGPFYLAHKQAVDSLITSLIKAEVVKHLNLTPEEVLIICEKSVIESLIGGYYNLRNYK